MTLFSSERIHTAVRALIVALMTVCALSAHARAAGASIEGVEGLARVERVGQGDQAMVLIPGMLSDDRVWETFAQRNEDRYTMYLVTLAGFDGGDAPSPPEDIHSTPWINQAAQGVLDLIEQEELEDTVVVGHALGGQVAILAGLEGPEAVAGVITIDGLPGVVLPKPTPADQRAAIIEMTLARDLRPLPEDMWDAQLEILLQQFDEEQREEMSNMFHIASRETGVEYTIQQYKLDLTPRMKNFEPRGLAIVPSKGAAERGGSQLKRLQRQWTKQTRKAERFDIVYLDDASHFVMLSNPADLDELVSEFVTDIEKDRQTE